VSPKHGLDATRVISVVQSACLTLKSAAVRLFTAVWNIKKLHVQLPERLFVILMDLKKNQRLFPCAVCVLTECFLIIETGCLPRGTE